VPVVPEYRISYAAELMGVSDDTMRRWVEASRVRSHQGPGGRRLIDGEDLARLAVELAEERPGQSGDASPRAMARSARNHFVGIVTKVTTDAVAAQVEIQAGPHRFVSLITREAVDELGLAPGVVAAAVVKATNVGVEVPTPR
jgi:molybdopterin-binding protein